jgi:hypothetical protein
MRDPAKYLPRFLCAAVLVLVAAVTLIYAVDPLQLFRPARLFAAMYSQDPRMQDAGLIRSQPFDTVFMGTSLAVHYRQSDIDRHLGVRSLKLAFAGATSKEQKFVLDTAMERHPKRVLWSMDDWIFRDSADVDADNSYLPVNLYRRNARGIASYLFSGSMARESLWIALRSIPPLQPLIARLTTGVVFRFAIADVDDINALHRSFDVAGFYNAKNALASFRRAIDPANRALIAAGYDYEAMVTNFERDAIRLIAANPQVKFDIYFPPYSILHFAAMRDASPSTLKIVTDFSAYAAPRLLQFSNVALHDFREAREITHNLNNYGDIIHHSPATDVKVLLLLAERKYVVDPAAPLASLQRLKAQIEAYQVER